MLKDAMDVVPPIWNDEPLKVDLIEVYNRVAYELHTTPEVPFCVSHTVDVYAEDLKRAKDAEDLKMYAMDCFQEARDELAKTWYMKELEEVGYIADVLKEFPEAVDAYDIGGTLEALYERGLLDDVSMYDISRAKNYLKHIKMEADDILLEVPTDGTNLRILLDDLRSEVVETWEAISDAVDTLLR